MSFIRLGRSWFRIFVVLFLGMAVSLPGTARPVPKKKAPRQVSSTLPTKKNILGMTFVLVPAGTFTMGTTDRQPGEMPRTPHEVTLTKAFYIQTTEVTQAQWGQVMNMEPWASCRTNVLEGDNYPAVYMTWSEIQDFILKLTLKGEGTYRLPTEAEWEYACRAGSKTRYSFGDAEEALDRYAWYNPGSQQMMDMQWQQRGLYPHKVATKKPNRWGLFDMHGNVLEVCQDGFGPYPNGPATDPLGPDRGGYKVLRGGCFNVPGFYCRSDFRGKYDPSMRSETLGFRLVMDAE